MAGRRHRLFCCLAIAIASLALGSVAQAQSVDAQSLDDWLQHPYMTGDWGGLRTKLEAEGFHLRAHYLSETAGNPSGGLKQGTQYAQQVDFGADLDLGKLANLPGGQVHITFTDRAGQSLAALDVGNLISEQEIFGAEFPPRRAVLSAIPFQRPPRGKARLDPYDRRFRHIADLLLFPEQRLLRPAGGNCHRQRRHHLPRRELGRHREAASAAGYLSPGRGL
jgi:hypothetical protein